MRMLTLAVTAAAAALLAGGAYAQMTPDQPPSPEGTAQDQVHGTANVQPDPSVTVTRRTVTVPTEAAPADATPMDSTQPMEPASAPAAVTTGSDVAAREPAQTVVIANAPIPDTPENRRKYGGPESHGGKATRAKGN